MLGCYGRPGKMANSSGIVDSLTVRTFIRLNYCQTTLLVPWSSLNNAKQTKNKAAGAT